jgi:hypothetical protein
MRLLSKLSWRSTAWRLASAAARLRRGARRHVRSTTLDAAQAAVPPCSQSPRSARRRFLLPGHSGGAPRPRRRKPSATAWAARERCRRFDTFRTAPRPRQGRERVFGSLRFDSFIPSRAGFLSRVPRTRPARRVGKVRRRARAAAARGCAARVRAFLVARRRLRLALGFAPPRARARSSARWRAAHAGSCLVSTAGSGERPLRAAGAARWSKRKSFFWRVRVPRPLRALPPPSPRAALPPPSCWRTCTARALWLTRSPPRAAGRLCAAPARRPPCPAAPAAVPRSVPLGGGAANAYAPRTRPPAPAPAPLPYELVRAVPQLAALRAVAPEVPGPRPASPSGVSAHAAPQGSAPPAQSPVPLYAQPPPRAKSPSGRVPRRSRSR